MTQTKKLKYNPPSTLFIFPYPFQAYIYIQLYQLLDTFYILLGTMSILYNILYILHFSLLHLLTMSGKEIRMDNMVIINRLKALIVEKEMRENRKLTYRKIAEETGISTTTIVKYTTQQVERVDLTTLETLCEYFNVGLGELLIWNREVKTISLLDKIRSYAALLQMDGDSELNETKILKLIENEIAKYPDLDLDFRSDEVLTKFLLAVLKLNPAFILNNSSNTAKKQDQAQKPSKE